MTKYRIGLVGCGGIAHAHLQGYQVVAGCHSNLGRLHELCDQHALARRLTRLLSRCGLARALAHSLLQTRPGSSHASVPCCVRDNR